MNRSDEIFELVQRYQDGVACAEEVAQLESRLSTDAAFRMEYLRYANADAALCSVAPAGVPDEFSFAANSLRDSWLKRTASTLMKIAAGIVIGGLGASVAWAYSIPAQFEQPSQPLPLADGSFESGEAPKAKGVPVVPGLWSGDYSRVTKADLGVQPHQGLSMLRFLRPDNENSRDQGDHRAYELWQIVDVRKARAHENKEGLKVEFSGWFRAAQQGAGQRPTFGVAILAFQGSPDLAPEIWKNRREEALVWTDKSEIAITQWTRIATQLAIPAEADFLLVQVRVLSKIAIDSNAVETPGYFVDQIELRALESTPAKNSNP